MCPIFATSGRNGSEILKTLALWGLGQGFHKTSWGFNVCKGALGV